MKKLSKTQEQIAEGPYQPPMPGQGCGPQFTIGSKRKHNTLPEEYYKSESQMSVEGKSKKTK